jgi:dihydroorotate dehydrogenase electron transfer subunit
MSRPDPSGPVQVTGQVVTLRRAGAYLRLVLQAPQVASRVRPGQFVAVAVGGPATSMLLRRSFSVYRADEGGGLGGTVEIVFAVHGKGTEWMSGLRAGDAVDVVGPLGRPFSLPREAVSAVLVGGGYGSAPLFGLAARLRERGCATHMILGAATDERLFGVLEAKRSCDSLGITTEDGSRGRRGRVTDLLTETITGTRSEVVYACGPMGMLAAVALVARDAGAHSQCAVEETMACGIGVCMTCVLPVVGADGQTRMLRSCVDGPVFRGEQVRWDAVGTVPPDAVGAPPAEVA